jgi:hypothetical protein
LEALGGVNLSAHQALATDSMLDVEVQRLRAANTPGIALIKPSRRFS